jgi:hypothetical protein
MVEVAVKMVQGFEDTCITRLILRWWYSMFCSHGDAKIIVLYLIVTSLEESSKSTRYRNTNIIYLVQKSFNIRIPNTLCARNKVGQSICNITMRRVRSDILLLNIKKC